MRRALLVAGGAVALTAAGAFAFAPGRAPIGQRDDAQGIYCPVRPAASGQTALLSVDSGAHMTTIPRVHTSIDSLAITAESLLAPVPTICRSAPDTTAQRSTAP